MAVTTKDRKQTKAGRFYEVPEIGPLPSVTTILQVVGKPALVPWAAKVEREMVIEASSNLYLDVAGTPPMSKAGWITTLLDRIGKTRAHVKETQKASEIGSQAHALIEWRLKAKMLMEAGPAPSVTDKAVIAFNAWEKWAESVALKPIFIEQVVYSVEYGFAGTLDLFAEVNGVPTVIDWKTGKAVYAEAHLQNASYRHALREMRHGDPQAGMIIRLPKVETDPEFEVVMARSEEECFPIFLNTLELWKWSNARSEEENKVYNEKQLESKRPKESVLNEHELEVVIKVVSGSKLTAPEFVEILKGEFGVESPNQLRISQFGDVIRRIHSGKESVTV